MNGNRKRIVLALTVSAAILSAGCQQGAPEGMVGTLERNRVELGFETNEPIAEILVADGERVEKGTLLISQDGQRLEIQLARLEAEHERAAARLAELERGPREESIREARAVLESAQAETRNARAELERAKGVFDKGLASQQTLDRAQTRFNTAVSLESARRESLDALLNGTTTEELQQAAAAVKSAAASVDEARLALERTRLLAPVDGLVDKVLARVGERPVPGQSQLIFLDTARTYARVYVPEHLKSDVRPGDSLEVRVDGQAAPFTGTVRWVSSDASFTPYFALTEHDRSRLSYVAEIDLPSAGDLPVGVPLVVALPATENSD